jgi:aminoglycoside 6-adenylyltransferase
MMDLILGFAKNDERVRLVFMEGSRLNKNAPRDRFQDYDIAFFVTNMASYRENDDWLDVFGRRIIMQKPQSMTLFPPEPGNQHNYLMLYEDGNRIDLALNPLDEFEALIRKADSLTKVLLDKDGRCPPLPEPSDRDYHVKKPSAEFVDDCCNEFWWLSTYVAKGLCRNELLYALHHLELMQKQLLTMVSWKAGADRAVSVGKSFKYLEKFVSPALWERILQSYGVPSVEGCRRALQSACALFREVSAGLAAALGYKIPPYGDKVEPYLNGLLREEGLKSGFGAGALPGGYGPISPA